MRISNMLWSTTLCVCTCTLTDMCSSIICSSVCLFYIAGLSVHSFFLVFFVCVYRAVWPLKLADLLDKWMSSHQKLISLHSCFGPSILGRMYPLLLSIDPFFPSFSLHHSYIYTTYFSWSYRSASSIVLTHRFHVSCPSLWVSSVSCFSLLCVEALLKWWLSASLGATARFPIKKLS